MDVQTLIKQWPSRPELAAEAGVSVGTVNQWHNRGAIPARHHLAVLKAAEARGIPLDARRLAEIHARERQS